MRVKLNLKIFKKKEKILRESKNRFVYILISRDYLYYSKNKKRDHFLLKIEIAEDVQCNKMAFLGGVGLSLFPSLEPQVMGKAPHLSYEFFKKICKNFFD